MRRVTIACSTIVAVHAACAQPAVVGFDATRGGTASLAAGSGFTQMRDGLLAAFPGMTIRSVGTISGLNPATDDVVILSSARGAVSAITPLTAQEQTNLRTFVEAGGAAILFVDNDTFAGAASDPANESMIDPFGLDIAGTGAGWQRTAHITNPASTTITTGQFGTITSFGIGWTGWFTNLGPYATSLATTVDNAQPCLAMIPCNTISPGSGPVVIFADSTMAANGYMTPNNLSLIENAMAFATQSCVGGCDSIDFNNDGLFPDTTDIEDFLSVFSGGPCSTAPVPGCNDADFNNDGLLPDTLDIESLLSVFSGGPCL
mgnify:CR=1 FL=1